MLIRDYNAPNQNELHHKIAALHRTCQRREYDEAARLRKELSQEALQTLRGWGSGELPSTEALQNPNTRDTACGTIAVLCQFGGRLVGDRSRGSEKRSPPDIRPYLRAPRPSRNFLKTEAERIFVIWLSVAWLEATGKRPAATARHADAGRKVGPFARLVHECLQLIGIKNADVVELINGLDRRRRDAKRKAPLSTINS
jgi:hypothetical protein